ncbi:MAG: hypothetical protein H6981_09840 [Gammaproteobacteria bacterium]|nr:hypothetical protein [Gammaproteobacteria bacterium]MCP5137089.1 hypothetical protein [Gammaproteobacteria bacterium]
MPEHVPGARLFISLWLTFSCALASADHITFAAPVSGAKVERYETELTLPRNQSQKLTVPNDCEAILARQSSETRHWGNPVEQRLWHKVINDCRYHAFLHRYPAAPNDFVSDVDFWNARIDQLPFPNACADLADCPSLPKGVAFAASMFAAITSAANFPPPTPATNPLPDTAAASPAHALSNCHFVDGLFRGYLQHDPGSVAPWRCLRDPKAPGFRLLSVDYSDVNGDGYQDAVLRLIPLGSGTSRAPRVLPVTRLSATGPLILPP